PWARDFSYASRLAKVFAGSISGLRTRFRSVRNVLQAADEAPAAAEFADGEHEFVAALFEGKINGVVFRIDDAEKTRVAKSLRAAPAPKSVAIEKNADVVAVANFQFFHLVAIGFDGGARVKDFHAGLRLKASREVALKCDAGMRSFAITVEDDEAGRFGFDILPLDRLAFCS